MKFHCCSMDEDSKEEDVPEERVSSTTLRDKCNRLSGLMQCLTWVIDTHNFKDYLKNPHHDLIMTIEDGIEEIERLLRNL